MLRKSALLILLILLTLTTLTACETQKEKESTITTGIINIGPASDFPAGTINTKFQSRYGIVIVNEDGTPLALLPKCTHDAVPLKWNATHHEFICPNDGSCFDILGRVQKAPATKNLPGILPDHQPDGTLTVDLTKLYGS